MLVDTRIYQELMRILLKAACYFYVIAEGVDPKVSMAVEVVPIPLHPIIQFSFMFIVY